MPPFERSTPPTIRESYKKTSKTASEKTSERSRSDSRSGDRPERLSRKGPSKKADEPAKSDTIRLNRYIASCGLTSRRKADRLIEEGRVRLNGDKVFEMGVQIDPRNDEVTVDGKAIRAVDEKIYLMFNKPKEVITSLSDPEGRACVGDYFKDFGTRLFPVGRLDWDTEGLLIMTNDGDFANKLMHPREEVPKTYLAKVNGHPTDEDLAKLKRGISIIGGKATAKDVERVNRGSDQYQWIKITITEGKNRQIRLMFEKLGFDVLKLQRTTIGQLSLGTLERGEYAPLNRRALERLFMKEAPIFKVQNKSQHKRPRVLSTKRRLASSADLA